VCCELDIGIEPTLLWWFNAIHPYRTNWNCGVWLTLSTYRVCYVGNITDHDNVGVVWGIKTHLEEKRYISTTKKAMTTRLK
jgi:hypothetical protein